MARRHQMSKLKINEYHLLIHIVKYCESNGSRHDHVTCNIDHELIEDLYDQYGIEPTIQELQIIVDRCLARDWLSHTFIGGDKYKALSLTSKGFGVAISKRRTEEELQSRSSLKKASDYIENHKGIFLLIGTIIALTGIITTIYYGK